ncbi:hypothetical protein [Sphingopyxis chilensis]
MTLYEEIVAALNRDPRISCLHGALSAGDRSIIAMLLDTEESFGTTVEGSPNAQFWACLSEHGWMEQPNGLPDLGSVPVLRYRLTDVGWRAIPVVLDMLNSQSARI